MHKRQIQIEALKYIIINKQVSHPKCLTQTRSPK